MGGMAMMSAQSGGDAGLWALAAVVAAALLAGAAMAVRRSLRFPEFDFACGYDALTPAVEGPRLYIVQR